MAVTIKDNPAASRFEALVDDEPAGFAAYRRHGDAVVLTHTEIDDAFEGQGVGSRLARGTLDALRGRDLAVLPSCPFMAGFIRNHPDEYLDLVPEDRRGEFDL